MPWAHQCDPPGLPSTFCPCCSICKCVILLMLAQGGSGRAQGELRTGLERTGWPGRALGKPRGREGEGPGKAQGRCSSQCQKSQVLFALQSKVQSRPKPSVQKALGRFLPQKYLLFKQHSSAKHQIQNVSLIFPDMILVSG